MPSLSIVNLWIFFPTLLCTLFTTTTVFAAATGNRVGNGGDVIVCEKTKELLDLFEGDLPAEEKAKTDPATTSLTPEALAGLKIQALEKLDPTRYAQFKNRIRSMQAEIEWKKNANLVDIPDSEHLVLPKKCTLVQAAIRRTKVAKGEKTFLFDLDLWEELPPRDAAALLTHEVIYEYFSKLGEVNSVKARKYNVKLYDEGFAKMKPGEYWEWLRSLRIPIYPNS